MEEFCVPTGAGFLKLTHSHDNDFLVDINGDASHLHCYQVDVYNGDDDYHLKEKYILKDSGGDIQVSKATPITPERLGHRARNELCVKMYFVNEQDHKRYVINFAHHKGQTFLSMDILSIGYPESAKVVSD